MSMVGRIKAAGRQFAHWFGGLALSARAGIAIAAFATMSAGVVIGVPYTPTSVPWSIPTVGPYETMQTPSPLKPSMVEAAAPISSTASSDSGSAGKPTTTSVSNTQAPPSATSTSAGAASSRPATTMAPATTTAPTKANGKALVTTAPQASSSVYYKNCPEASRSGAAPITSGQPGYRSGLDSNHNGVACE